MTVAHAAALAQNSRLRAAAHLHVFIAKARFKADQRSAALFNIAVNARKQAIIRGVESGYDQHAVARGFLVNVVNNIEADIVVVQRIVEAAENIVINIALRVAGAELVEGVHRLIADQQRDVVFRLQLRQLRRQAGEVSPDSGGLLPGRVARKVMA